MSIKTLIIGANAAALAAVALTAAEVDISKVPPASDKKGLTFEKDIKPLFEKSCVKCHGAEKQKGKLRVDTLAAAMKGGENGESILPGKGQKSPIVHYVAGLVEDTPMPPEGKGDPWTKEQIGLLRAWIDQGAK